MAHQNSPLPLYTDNGTDRETDWVIGDEDKLVGYESKYGDSLHRKQLEDELDKLRLNVDGRDIYLVTVRPHTTPPALVDWFKNDPVEWLSWDTIARRCRQIAEEDVESPQRPLLRMLQDLFEAEDMHPFTGFDHQDKLQYRYFIRDLRQELVDTELENPERVHTSTTNDPEPTTWKRLVPKHLDVPFVRESRTDDWKRQRSYLTVTVDIEKHEVHAGIVFNLREVKSHREYIADSLDEIVEYAAAQDLELWASMNSFNQWELGIPKTGSPAEKRRWLEGGSKNMLRAEETDFKKAIFVREYDASEPAGLIGERKEQLLGLNEQFLIADNVYPWPTLEGPE